VNVNSNPQNIIPEEDKIQFSGANILKETLTALTIQLESLRNKPNDTNVTMAARMLISTTSQFINDHVVMPQNVNGNVVPQDVNGNVNGAGGKKSSKKITTKSTKTPKKPTKTPKKPTKTPKKPASSMKSKKT
jgi:hypothetical protein